MPLTPLTIFTLAVTSQHASDTAYHPYTCIVPTQHASDTAYHPYVCSALLPPHTGLILMLLQPPQDETTMPPSIFSCLLLLWRPQDMPLTPPSAPLTPNPLSAAYHPYAQVLDP
ncbi:hypothetical protein O181_075100 [Austropuccinia psidii MF-1]|uniref:Secreted protein n=1 Tax=Austropuccinia psidii MF-1 TaxID=1389203 RepID=A0A9Q3FDR1_9BASI|nr:hypothetical protein [Austropuccinia psidii MF-1]